MTYDIIIVGGGITGLSLACALAQQTSLSIAVLEANAKPMIWSSDHYHHRVSAVTLASQRIFQSLGVWDFIKEQRISPFTQIHVWDNEAQGEIRFDSQEIATSSLGFIIENNLLQWALQERLAYYPQIDFISAVQLQDFHATEFCVELIAADQKCYQAKLVIAADGAKSWLREKAGITVDTFDYEQEAIVATVKTSLPHEKIARQVFLPSGPLAFLPLQGPYTSSIVWTLPATLAQEYLQLGADIFREKLSHAFSHKLGNV